MADEYREKNRERVRANARARYWRDEERREALVAQTRERNRARRLGPEERKKDVAAAKAWKTAHPQERRALNSRHSFKRKRGFPTRTILGHPFPKACLHHLTPDAAVYIPEALHRSVIHSLVTGSGMAEINAAAIAFYESGALRASRGEL